MDLQYEPVRVWQDETTGSVWFDVIYEGETRQLELVPGHAGWGEALIMRGVYVSPINPNLSDGRTIGFELKTYDDGEKLAIVKNMQFINMEMDEAVFVRQPSGLFSNRFYQVRYNLRGYVDGQLKYWSLPHRTVIATSRGNYPINVGQVQSLTAENGHFRSGQFWNSFAISFHGGTSRSRLVDFYRPVYGDGAEYLMGKFWASEPLTYEQVVAHIKAGEFPEAIVKLGQINP
jgi:hypothetical protein